MAVFDDLNNLNVSGHTEEKNVGGTKLTYLSWPWAWAEVKKRYPDAHYEIWKSENNLPYAYDPQTGYMVYTSVTIEGVTHEMWLPVMDGANKAMKAAPYKYATRFGEKSVDAASMMDINKTIMRCLVKNLAMFGLGLYIYAGEDLPEAEQKPEEKPDNKDKAIPQKGKQEAGDVSKQKSLPLEKRVNKALGKEDEEAPPKPETPGEFVKRRISEIKAQAPDFDFIAARKALIDGGVIPDIPSATMTMDQARALMDAVSVTLEKVG